MAVSFLQNRGSLVKRASQHAKAPTTGESILAACQKRNIKVTSSKLQCGQYPDATLHEIKLSDQGDTLLYFHGGGYRNGIAGEGHVPVVLDCAAAAGASRVLFLEYVLTPELEYPGQLAQAARALDFLLNEQLLRPSELILGGDSAGGNLVLALLAHLKQPQPAVSPVKGFGVKDRFKGVFLISPWVTLPLSSNSFAENPSRDYTSKQTMATFVNFWSPLEEVWADPLQAGTEFWNTIPVERMFISVGGFECFRDDVVKMAKICDAAIGDRSTFILAPAEIHVQACVDRALGLVAPTSLVALLEWLRV